MRSFAGSALIAVAALLGGCATVNVDRAKDVSSAGIAYSQAVSAVVDLAIDASVDADSERLRQAKAISPRCRRPWR